PYGPRRMAACDERRDEDRDRCAMKICIVGAGSIGGYLAVRLARGRNQITVIARGAHLAAIRQRGLRLISAEGEETVRPHLATDKLEEAGRQDVVILTMKAHQVEPILPLPPSLLHPLTTIIPMQNGIPWWYFQK